MNASLIVSKYPESISPIFSGGGFVKSDLEICLPAKLLSFYLLFSIGFGGGVDTKSGVTRYSSMPWQPAAQ